MGPGHEALHSVTKIHDNAPFLEPDDTTLHFLSLGVLRHQARPWIIEQLLDAQRDALVVRVHVQDHDINLLALLHDLGGVFHTTCPAHVGDVHETVDPGFDLHECPERRKVPDRSGELRPRRVLHGERQPRILFDLLHAEGDLFVLRVDLQDHRLDLVADGNELGRVPNIARPRHFGDVDQPLDALLQLHEGAVVRDGHDLAAHARTNGVSILDVRPGIGQKLLESERDTLPVPVDVQYLHVQLLADAHDLGGMPDAAPRHVGDVKESVESAEIDKSTEVGDVLDDAFPDLAVEEFLHERGTLLLPLALEDDPARDDDVATALVELDDLEVVGVPDQILDVGNSSQGDLGSRQEGVHAHDVHRHPTLDLARQQALHGAVVLERVPDQLPDPEEVRLLLREHHDTVVVFEALEEYFDFLSGLDRLGVLEFVERNGALALEAEFEDDRRIGGPQNSRLDDLAFADVSAGRLVLGEHRLEVVPGDIEDLFAVRIVEQLRGDLVRVDAVVVRGRGCEILGIRGRWVLLCVVHGCRFASTRLALQYSIRPAEVAREGRVE